MTDIFVKLEIKTSSVRNDIEGIIATFQGVAILRPEDARRADLLIYELGAQVENDFQLIESLKNVNLVGEVFLTAKDPDPELLMRAIKIGAKEFLSQPLDAKQITQAIEAFKKKAEDAKPKEAIKFGRILTLMGSKGGVGTTTLAVNLATEFAEEKRRNSVVLVDMNRLYGEIPLFLEIKPKYNLGEITKHISRLDPTFLMDILSKHHSGVYVLPSESYWKEGEKTTPKIMERILTLLKRMFDYIIIDAGTSITDSSIKAFEMSDLIFIVSVLSLPCLANTSKLLTSLNEIGYPQRERIKVIINRYVKQSELTLKDASEGIKKDIYWTIPNDYKTTMNAINQGLPLSSVASHSPINKSLQELVATISGKQETAKHEKGSLFKWFSSKEEVAN
jgi:pilus assembly protein CpaE